MLVAAYVVGGLLEVAGIIIVLLDLRAGIKRADLLAAQLRGRPHISRHTPAERAGQIANRSAARADAQLADAITELLRGNVRRRLLGPGLLVLGVIVGTLANIAAL